jgi:hypothetical protein
MSYPFVQAKHYRKGRDGANIDLIVVHSMEAPEKGNTAEAVARYFQTTTRPASAHYCCDNDSIVQCVKDGDQAAAAPGSNRQGLHIELAGYARQTGAEWGDAYSDAMLKRAAVLAAQKATLYNVPVKWVTVSGLRAGLRGFTSHLNVSLAWKRSTHTDPGKGFPVAKFLGYVEAEMAKAQSGLTVAVEGIDGTELVPGIVDSGTTWVSLAGLMEGLDVTTRDSGRQVALRAFADATGMVLSGSVETNLRLEKP